MVGCFFVYIFYFCLIRFFIQSIIDVDVRLLCFEFKVIFLRGFEMNKFESIVETIKKEALRLNDIEKDKAVAKQICVDLKSEVLKLKELNADKFKNAFNHYFIDYLKNNYLEFNGRISRRQYWMFALFSCLVSFVIGIIGGIIPILSIISLLYALALIVPSVGLGIRRLHDLGLSGWFFLIALIPYIGGVLLVILFCIPGENKANEYGDK